MGSYRSARRQVRAWEFGRRHPRLTLVLACVFLAGLIAVCAVQIRHGTYLGRGWLIAAVAGMATAAAVSTAALISRLRPSPATGRIRVAWLVLGLVSASAIRYPFPQGHYGRLQAFFNVVHAALLGSEAVTCAAIIGLFAYLLIRPGALPSRADLRRLPRPQRRKALGWPGWVLAGAVAGLVAGFILAAANGHTPDAASTAAGGLILSALAALCVAVPAALYRRYRSRRAVAVPPSLPGTSTASDPAAQD